MFRSSTTRNQLRKQLAAIGFVENVKNEMYAASQSITLLNHEVVSKTMLKTTTLDCSPLLKSLVYSIHCYKRGSLIACVRLLISS